MPFAVVGAILGYFDQTKETSLVVFLYVILCMVFARNAAMAFNRWADRDIDGKNPRTENREIPAGSIQSNKVFLFVVVNAIFFIAICKLISTLCFMLSPIALLIILGYSYAKRFTKYAHMILGLGLALAPIGAYIAMADSITLIPVLIGFAVLVWVAGFDIIYALQDQEFDATEKLHSIPSKLGKNKSLNIALVLHLIAISLFMVATLMIWKNYDNMGGFVLIGLTLFVASIVYQHWLLRPFDIDKTDAVFFKTNGMASLLFGVFFLLDAFCL